MNPALTPEVRYRKLPSRLHSCAHRRWPPSLSLRAGLGQTLATLRHECRPESLELAPVLAGDRGRNDIACNRTLATEEIVDLVCICANRGRASPRACRV